MAFATSPLVGVARGLAVYTYHGKDVPLASEGCQGRQALVKVEALWASRESALGEALKGFANPWVLTVLD